VTKVFSATAAHDKKIEIRRTILKQVGAARVFEGFTGLGEMWQGAWADAESHTGCDLRPLTLDEPMPRMCCDNRLALRCLDLQKFNVFDFDAFGSPWNQCLILASRRKWAKGERGGLVLTDGCSMKIRFGELPHSMAKLIGCYPKVPALTSVAEKFQRLALLGFAKRAGVKIVKAWQFDGNGSGRGGQRMTYSAAILEGLGGPNGVQ
jgi:hypothetical protein